MEWPSFYFFQSPTHYLNNRIKAEIKGTSCLRFWTTDPGRYLVCEKAGLVGGLVVVAVLGLDRVAGQQDTRLGRAVDVHVQDGLFHLNKIIKIIQTNKMRP